MFFLATVFSIGLFVSDGHKKPYLYFSLICFAFCLESMWLSLSMLLSVSNEILFYHVPIIKTFTLIELLMLSFFIIYLFNLPFKKRLATLAIVLAVITTFYRRELGFSVSFAYSTLLGIFAVYKKRRGSVAVLTGLSSIYFLVYLLDIQIGYSIALIILIFCFVVAINQQISLQTQKNEKLRLKSVRLELELLKRNILPHFLLNTLLSVITWIEKKPKVAIELIKSLADEFRALIDISSKKLITLEDELKLCESHLKLMGYRKGSSYQIKTSNIDYSEEIPPMVFHTLIENGLTHSYLAGENGTFELSYTKADEIRHYKLINDGSLIEDVEEMSDSEIEEGFGLKYIKSRLEESFPKKWRMSYGVREKFWEVDIFIYA